MAVILINPNATASMTQSALEAARRAAPGLVIEGWTSHDGPPVIEGAADGRACVPPLLELVAQANAQGAEGIIIACFDDTGLAQARAASACPVIGIGQAAFHMATLAHGRFSVVTTVAAAVPVIRDNIATYGFGPQVGAIRASGVPVRQLDTDPAGALPALRAEIAAAEAADDARAIVLGCAGMVDVIAPLQGTSRLPLIDGVSAAARLMAACLP